MAFYPINMDGQLGLIRDIPGHMLQPNAWTDARNARMDNNLAGSVAGHVERYAGCPIVPYKAEFVPGENGLFWVLVGLTDVVVHDGSSYTEITRPLAVPFNSGSAEPSADDVITGAVSSATGKFASASLTSGTWAGGDAAGTMYLYDLTGTFNAAENLDNTTTATSDVATTNGAATEGDYTGTADDRWNGGVLSGILVLNNWENNPQYWATPETSTRLADLPNWPANTKAKVVRPFLNYLVALDVEKSGVRRPYLVKWSHAANPGAVPSSWDETDGTLDAGEYDLGQTEDFLIDCLSLGNDVNIIYKEQTAWTMQYIGHPYIFKFRQIPGMPGMFAQQCAAEITKGRHAVLTRGDFIVHNGRTFQSVIDGRNREWIFKAIDPDNWRKVFVAHVREMTEVWVCFPQVGASFCDQALIWNYREDTWSVRDLPGVTDIHLGIINPAVDDTWDGGSAEAWDSGQEIPWGSTEASPTRYRTLLVSPENQKVYEAESGITFDTVSFLTYLERVGLAIEPIKRSDSLTTNTESWKFLSSIRPRFRVPPQGGVIDVWVGTQEHVNADVVWQGPHKANAATEYKVDVTRSGRLFGVRFQSDDHFEIDGYDLELARLGIY